jgi:hypothetical protein
MAAVRVFLCHTVDPTSQRDTAILAQLLAKLQEMRIEIISYPGHPDEEEFPDFLQQQLPGCQWFILLQTPGIASHPWVLHTVDAALDLVDQRQMQGAVRVLTAPDEDQATPSEWGTLPTFDATYDPLRAMEKLSLTLTASRPEADLPPLVPPSLPRGISSYSSTYDRPLAPPSRLVKFREKASNNYQDLLYMHKKAVIIVSILVLLALCGSILGVLAFRPSSGTHARANPTTPVYGQVAFFSTNLAGTEVTTGIADGVTVSLQNLPSPATGNSYYAWLLPDAKNIEGPRILVGQFAPTHGRESLTFRDPSSVNLLATESRLLITEEGSSPVPSFPTPDLSKWRYYGELPQAPDPRDASHFSALDHLRHLLSDDSMMGMEPIPGGLGVWVLQNVRLVFGWASDARGIGNLSNPGQERADAIKILDALDGSESVHQDVPQGTPLLADQVVVRKPLLSIDPNAMVPGYLLEMHTHIFGFSESPGTTHSAQTLAGVIASELDTVTRLFGQVRQDAKQLVAKTDSQLLDPSTIPLLDELINQAMLAYNGTTDPTTGTSQGGVTLIFGQLLQLAQFPVIRYTSQIQV